MLKGSIGTTGVQLIVAALHLFVVTNIRCQNYNWSTADTEDMNKSCWYHDSNICSVFKTNVRPKHLISVSKTTTRCSVYDFQCSDFTKNKTEHAVHSYAAGRG